MSMSTLNIEMIHSDCLDTSDAPFKVVISTIVEFEFEEEDEDEIKTSYIIYRDGDHRNESLTNRIDRKWFEDNYDFQSFLEDYYLIHRLLQETEELKVHLFRFAKTQTANTKTN